MKPLGIIVNPKANRGGAAIIGEQVFEAFAKAGIAVINLSAATALEAKKKAEELIRLSRDIRISCSRRGRNHPALCWNSDSKSNTAGHNPSRVWERSSSRAEH